MIGLLFLLLAGGLLFFGGNKNTKNSDDQVSLKNPETLEKINRHMQDTNRQMYLQEQKAYIESKKSYNEFHKAPSQQPYQVDHSEVSIPQYEEGPQNFAMPKDPHDLIQEELFREQADRQYTEAYKKEYARQFVENAKAAGWLIKLDASYRIISVRPLRKPAEKLFPDSSGGR